MSVMLASATLRIGELATLVGTTPRTIRYYEQLGLLGEPAARPSGGHRTYTEADVAHLRELIRLRELLGLSLDELGRVIEAEEARALLRAEYEAGVQDPERLREIFTQALGHLDLQLALIERRRSELAALEDDLRRRREVAAGRLGALTPAPLQPLS
jgi:DNA-binding transcriptional MerR regulator